MPDSGGEEALAPLQSFVSLMAVGVNFSTVSFNSCAGMHAILSDWRGAMLKNHKS